MGKQQFFADRYFPGKVHAETVWNAWLLCPADAERLLLSSSLLLFLKRPVIRVEMLQRAPKTWDLLSNYRVLSVAQISLSVSFVLQSSSVPTAGSLHVQDRCLLQTLASLRRPSSITSDGICYLSAGPFSHPVGHNYRWLRWWESRPRANNLPSLYTSSSHSHLPVNLFEFNLTKTQVS